MGVTYEHPPELSVLHTHIFKRGKNESTVCKLCGAIIPDKHVMNLDRKVVSQPISNDPVRVWLAKCKKRNTIQIMAEILMQ